MGLIKLLYQDPVAFLILATLLLYSVILHEVAHGGVAYLFGDDTAKRSGRLTLAPLPHLNLMGTLALFLIGFGWAQPVPVNYSRLSHQRLGLFCVSFAGCAANILIASIAIALLQIETIRALPFLAKSLPILIYINITLGALNLIPIPPLDGSRIVMCFLPEQLNRALSRIEPYGFFILILLIVSGLLTPVIISVQKLIFSAIVSILDFLRLI
ncbi:MAG TPA: site-2 protease family protein [Candidatus Omnitrophota bacterium]|mgnify:FL=1|nr:site-2 protease family protein [Candidatus Omnitrophota bacterium]